MESAAEVKQSVKKIVRRKFRVEEAKAAKEVMAIGSGILAKAVVQWDGAQIEDGEPGLVFLSIKALMAKDTDVKYNPEGKEEVPYGYLTGM